MARYRDHVPGWAWLRSTLRSIASDVTATRRFIEREIPARFRHWEKIMTDVSSVLNDVADGLRGPLATSITDLINENTALAAENARLKGEDVAESDAAANVKAAFDEVAGKFAASPDVPDVDPLPTPDAPADGGDTSGTADPSDPGPVPGEDSNTSA